MFGFHPGYFSKSLLIFTRIYLVALSIFTINRIVLFFRFAAEDLYSNHWGTLLDVVALGFRFDTKMIIILLLPLLLVSIGLLFCIAPGFKAFCRGFYYWYSIIVLSFSTLLLFVDQQYYTYFQAHFNGMVFGIIQDDTLAVMASMWSDHPVLRILFVVACYIFCIHLILTGILKNFIQPLAARWYYQLSIPLVFIFLIFSGIRGTYSTFPLEKDDLNISDDPFINYLASNAYFALHTAIEDRSRSLGNEMDNGKLLSANGYNSIDQVLLDYYGNTKKISGNIHSDLFCKTDSNAFLKAQPPHVVFFQMESMSNYYLNFHNKKTFDLLGALEKHTKKDLFYRNFLSDENGTINCLETFITCVPQHPFAQSPYKYFSSITSIAKVYKDAGYQTIFITSGKSGWRNLDEFIPRNYFDKIYSKSTILSEITGSSECEWGAFDEYMFDYVYRLLEKSTKPVFIFALTTTNHTPFERPKHYRPLPLVMTDSIKSLVDMNHDRAEENFLNYQYVNDALGLFMDSIKKSPFKDKTIIGASGDHNCWMNFQFSDAELKYKHGVPFYLYAPEKYIEGRNTDVNRFGSHKDIFPTLYNLSLSEAMYFDMGNNLLGSDSTYYFGCNEKNCAISKDGAVVHMMDNPTYFNWSVQNESLQSSEPTAVLTAMQKKAKAREILLQYYFNEVLKKVQ